MSHMLDAAFSLVRAYPGGSLSLAPRMGKAHNTLSHEVSGRAGYKLGLDDAVAMSVLAADLRLLNAFAAEMGCMVLQLPDGSALGTGVMPRVGEAAREFGEFLCEVTSNAADGNISANDLRRVQKEWGDLMVVGHQLMAMLRDMHDTAARSAAL